MTDGTPTEPPTFLTRTIRSDSVASPRSEEDVIRIALGRIDDWILRPAERLGSDEHAGFALLLVLLVYFDLIEQYQRGKHRDGATEDMFGAGVESVFPREFSPQQKRRLYYEIRCGIYHSGFPREGVILSGEFEEPIRFEKTLILVNPNELRTSIRDHFSRFSSLCGSDPELRQNVLAVEAQRGKAALLRPRRVTGIAERLDAKREGRLSEFSGVPMSGVTPEGLSGTSGPALTGDLPPPWPKAHDEGD